MGLYKIGSYLLLFQFTFRGDQMRNVLYNNGEWNSAKCLPNKRSSDEASLAEKILNTGSSEPPDKMRFSLCPQWDGTKSVASQGPLITFAFEKEFGYLPHYNQNYARFDTYYQKTPTFK